MFDWRRRWLVTLNVLVLLELGLWVPLPGLGDVVFARFRSGDASFPIAERATSLMALGIMPYLSAAGLVMLLSGISGRLRRLRDGDPDERVRFDRVVLVITALIGTLQGARLAGSIVEHLSTDTLAMQPDAFIPMTALTLGVASLLVAGLARIATRWGLFNGVALILFVSEARRVVGAIGQILRTPPLPAPESRHWLGLALLSLALVVLLVLWLRARRPLCLQDAEGKFVYAAPLRPNLTGALPMFVAASALGLLGTIPALRDQVWNPTAPVWVWALRLGIIAAANLLLTAWLLDPADLQRRAARWGLRLVGESSEAALDRLLLSWYLPHTLFLCLLALAPALMLRLARLSPGQIPLTGTGALVTVALILEGWRLLRPRCGGVSAPTAVLLRSRVRLEPEIACALLRRSGIEAHVEDDRCIGITGSRAPWEISSPRFPAFFIYPVLGGGEVRLVVPVAQAEAAVQALRLLAAETATSPSWP